MATVLVGLALPAVASNMGFKLERTIAPSPMAHQVVGVNFSNGRVLTIIVSANDNPDQLASDMFAGTGCSVARIVGIESIDSCVMGGNPALGCTRFKTSCSLLGYASTTTSGFKLERAVTFLASRSSTKALEVWDGVWTLPAKTTYVSVEWPGANAEAHATVSTSTTKDNGVLGLLATATPRFLDIPQVARPAHKVDRKTCSVLLEGGGCTGSIRRANASGSTSVFQFPSRVLSFP